MKKLIFLLVAALAFASCSQEENLGTALETQGGPISFNLKMGNAVRSTTTSGKDAADLLDNNFVVYGGYYKNSDFTTVFNHYNVNYSDSKWVYEGKDFHSLSGTSGSTQPLNYWFTDASRYEFVAFSTGGGSAEPTAIQWDNLNSGTVTTFTGSFADLQKCYVSNLKTVESGSYTDADVTLTFKHMLPVVGIELINGSSNVTMKNVKFYDGSDYGDTPYLTGTFSGTHNGNNTINISFNSGVPSCAYDGLDTENNLSLGGFTYADTQNSALSSTGSSSNYVPVMPVASTSTMTPVLKFKCDIVYNGNTYTREFTVTIPVNDAKWQSGYKYTYKITVDNPISADTQKPINFTAEVEPYEVSENTETPFMQGE